MTEHDTGDVPGAFEMLLEEVDAEIRRIAKVITTKAVAPKVVAE